MQGTGHIWRADPLAELDWRVTTERGEGQEQAAWNRVDYLGTQRGSDQLCEWCLDRPALPWAGAEPLILIGGEWLHPDCAESMAIGRASEARLAVLDHLN